MSAVPITIVLARADNGVIGAGGSLPWRFPDDLRRFKQLTLGKPCIMGRKTWDSLPRRPLPGRVNIVVTRSPGFAAEGAVVAHSFDEALVLAAEYAPAEIMVIGGAEIFAAALPKTGRIELTEVHASPAGDVSMPVFAPQDWQETFREAHGAAHSYVTLRRIRPES